MKNLTDPEVVSRAAQLSAQLEPAGGHAAKGMSNWRSIASVIEALRDRIATAAQTSQQPDAAAIATEAAALLDAAKAALVPVHVNYPEVFRRMAIAEFAAVDLEQAG